MATDSATRPEASSDSAVGGTGAAALGGRDGITGTFKGKTYTFTTSPMRIPQQTPTALISASDGTSETWSVRLRPEIGVQDCTGKDGAGDPAISFRSLSTLDNIGTTGTLGTCSINVTSVDPKFEGSFIATIVTSAGNLVVTDGYFRIAK